MNDIEYKNFENTWKYTFENDKNRIKELSYKFFKEATSPLAIGLYGALTFISSLNGNINQEGINIVMAMNQTRVDQDIATSKLEKIN